MVVVVRSCVRRPASVRAVVSGRFSGAVDSRGVAGDEVAVAKEAWVEVWRGDGVVAAVEVRGPVVALGTILGSSANDVGPRDDVLVVEESVGRRFSTTRWTRFGVDGARIGTRVTGEAPYAGRPSVDGALMCWSGGGLVTAGGQAWAFSEDDDDGLATFEVLGVAAIELDDDDDDDDGDDGGGFAALLGREPCGEALCVHFVRLSSAGATVAAAWALQDLPAPAAIAALPAGRLLVVAASQARVYDRSGACLATDAFDGAADHLFLGRMRGDDSAAMVCCVAATAAPPSVFIFFFEQLDRMSRETLIRRTKELDAGGDFFQRRGGVCEAVAVVDGRGWVLSGDGALYDGDGAARCGSKRRVLDSAAIGDGRVATLRPEEGLEATVVGAAVFSSSDGEGLLEVRKSTRLFACRGADDDDDSASKRDLVVADDAALWVSIDSSVAERIKEGASFCAGGTVALGRTALNGLVHVGPGTVHLLRTVHFDCVAALAAGDVFSAPPTREAPRIVAAAVGLSAVALASHNGHLALVSLLPKTLAFASAVARADVAGALGVSAVALSRATLAVACWDGSVRLFDAPTMDLKATLARIPPAVCNNNTGGTFPELARSALFAGSTLVLGLASGCVALVDAKALVVGRAPHEKNKKVIIRTVDLGGSFPPIERLVELPSSKSGLRCVLCDGGAVLRFDGAKSDVQPVAPLGAPRRSTVALQGGALAWVDGHGRLRRGALVVDAKMLDSPSSTVLRVNKKNSNNDKKKNPPEVETKETSASFMCYHAEAKVFFVVVTTKKTARRRNFCEIRLYAQEGGFSYPLVFSKAVDFLPLAACPCTPPSLDFFGAADEGLLGALTLAVRRQGASSSSSSFDKKAAAQKVSSEDVLIHCEIRADAATGKYDLPPLAALALLDAVAEAGLCQLADGSDAVVGAFGSTRTSDDSARGTLRVLGWKREGQQRRASLAVLGSTALSRRASAMSASHGYVAVALAALSTAVYKVADNNEFSLVAVEPLVTGRFCRSLAILGPAAAADADASSSSSEKKNRTVSFDVALVEEDPRGGSDVVRVLRCAPGAPTIRVLEPPEEAAKEDDHHVGDDVDEPPPDVNGEEARARKSRSNAAARELAEIANFRFAGAVDRIFSVADAFFVVGRSGALEHCRLVDVDAEALLTRADADLESCNDFPDAAADDLAGTLAGTLKLDTTSLRPPANHHQLHQPGPAPR